MSLYSVCGGLAKGRCYYYATLSWWHSTRFVMAMAGEDAITMLRSAVGARSVMALAGEDAITVRSHT